MYEEKIGFRIEKWKENVDCLTHKIIYYSLRRFPPSGQNSYERRLISEQKVKYINALDESNEYN